MRCVAAGGWGGWRTEQWSSEELEAPRELLEHLYEIERLEITRPRSLFEGLASPFAGAMRGKSACSRAWSTKLTTRGQRDQARGTAGGVGAGRQDWILRFAERYSFDKAGEKEAFAARVAGKLQSSFWQNPKVKGVMFDDRSTYAYRGNVWIEVVGRVFIFS